MLIHLQPDTGQPLYQQVFDAIRRAIINEQLQGHQQLPPSRELAHQLALSRNTVNTAYAQLCAEGYIVAHQGSGYFVNTQLPDLSHIGVAPPQRQSRPKSALEFSKRGEYLARPTRPVPKTDNPAFQPGLPDLSEFPFAQWRRCQNLALKRGDQRLFRYSDSGGYLPLKQALQRYLSHSRGVHCQPEQIVVVNGSQAGLDLITRLLIDNGDTIAMEEPGYLGARDGFLAAGANLRAIPVDRDGLLVNKLHSGGKPIRVVYTTPSYQFPLGVTLSLPRRLALLEWARQYNGFIIEDDYDSEFRYRDRPLSSLQGLDNSGRVIYFGTFSKVMFPGLRMGYLVVPENLAEGFAKALRKTGQDSPLPLQAALCEFIEQGFFARHIRRMRTLYGEKQQMFVDLAQNYLADWLDVRATDAGMQLPAFFKQVLDVNKLTVNAREADLVIPLLQQYYLKKSKHSGLFLGYAGVPLAEMKKQVLGLQTVLQAAHNNNC